MKQSMFLQSRKKARIALAVLALCGLTFIGGVNNSFADNVDEKPLTSNYVDGNNNHIDGNYNNVEGNENLVIGYPEEGDKAFDNNQVYANYTNVIGKHNFVAKGADYGIVYGIENGLSGSAALGYRNAVSGIESVGVGSHNYAEGNYTTALGSYSWTDDISRFGKICDYKVTIGSCNKAVGEHALAIGTGVIIDQNFASNNTLDQDSEDMDSEAQFSHFKAQFSENKGYILRNTAIGESANAIGFLNYADGTSAIAFGSGLYTSGQDPIYNEAKGDYSIALGHINTVSGAYSNAIGAKNTISEEHSNAFGSENTIKRKNSLAIGYNNSVLGTNTVSSPNYTDLNLSGTAEDTTLSGTTVTDNADNAADNAKYQMGAISIGYDNKIYGNRSIALGIDSQAGTDKGEGYNIAIGSYARALSDNGIAMGRNAATNGPAAMAIGMEAKAKDGYYGMAFGANSYVDKKGAIAIGGISKATAENSVAIGYLSQATEENTVSFGGTGADGKTITRRLTNLDKGIGENDATTVKQVKEAISSAAGSIKVKQGKDKKEKNLQEAVTSIDTIIGTGELTVKDSAGNDMKDLTSAANAINAKADTNAKNIGTISELNKDLQNGDETNLVSAINKAYQAGSDASKSIGTMDDLKTTENKTLVGAINEVKSNVETNAKNIGTLGNLETTKKDNLVSAVNEVKSTADINAKNIGTLSNLAEGLKNDGGDVTLVDAINNVYNAAHGYDYDKVMKEIGGIEGLSTVSTNIVGAVNEVNNKVGDLGKLHGDIQNAKSDSMARSANNVGSLVEAINNVSDKTGFLDDLETDNKENVVGAINEVNKKVNTASGAVGDVKDLDADIKSNTVVGATNNLNHKVDRLGSRLNKVGAGAAALAALHPMDYDPEDKLSFAAGFGNYGGENAIALGAFYRPNENVMFNIGGNMGNGENMVNAGVSFALGSGSHGTTSKAAMAQKLAVQDEEISQLHAKLEEEHAKNVQQGAMIEEQNARIEKLEALIQQLANK